MGDRLEQELFYRNPVPAPGASASARRKASAFGHCNNTDELLKTVSEFTQRREHVRRFLGWPCGLRRRIR
ncbi:MAG: hypothetical protein K8F29_08590 [Kofleriaceae bacterium]|nr:hypothetical protein [Candidatus Methylomirabilis lanthanidiphila]